MKKINQLFIAVALLLSGASFAEESAAPPVALVELFTSQGCYSCPPADKLLADNYLSRDDVAALELHVDYWDDLRYGSAGVWADPFSSPAHTSRQQSYNKKLRRTRSVFTPQAVIHGAHQTGGTQKTRIDSFILQSLQTPPQVRFYFGGDAKSGFTVHIKGALEPQTELLYAVYRRRVVTEVAAGENKGKSLANHNIVREINRQPAVGNRRLQLPKMDATREGCVVWIQRGGAGRVISAARCPEV